AHGQPWGGSAGAGARGIGRLGTGSSGPQAARPTKTDAVWGVGARHRPCVPPGTSRIKPRAPPRVARCDRGCQSPGVTVRFARLDPLPHQRRSLLPLRGPDTTRFVQGIVSTNVEGLPPDRAVAAGLLTVKGKLISE